jgi:hypothetical protein
VERRPVESEALRSVGYDRRSRVLEIEFTSGAVYRYLGVPEQTHAALMRAESLGGFFSEHIRDAGFMLDRLAEPEHDEREPPRAAVKDVRPDRPGTPGAGVH